MIIFKYKFNTELFYEKNWRKDNISLIFIYFLMLTKTHPNVLQKKFCYLVFPIGYKFDAKKKAKSMLIFYKQKACLLTDEKGSLEELLKDFEGFIEVEKKDNNYILKINKKYNILISTAITSKVEKCS